jgi:hypothetical protein
MGVFPRSPRTGLTRGFASFSPGYQTSYRAASGKVQAGPSDIKETAVETMTPTTMSDTATTAPTGITESTQEAKDTACSAVRSFAKENALALSLGAFAAGIIVGLCIPRMRVDERRITPLAGEVGHRVIEAGQRVVQIGQQMAKERFAA